MRIKEELLMKGAPKWFESVNEAAMREFGDSDFADVHTYKGIVFCSMTGVDAWQFKSLLKICDELHVQIDIEPQGLFSVRGVIYRNQDVEVYFETLEELEAP